ncbi:hypothetical protein [Defluviimonas sp. SAOS-178_SWC]|uniref:hypothetical protein n=1 Tax=Defluviimonas sp. SAOS-178_SWC TaxID=3121287 RepID=UPI003221A50C
MARENRVTPEGEIIADPGRGLLTGNRGILCDEAGTRRHLFRHRAWISCVLHYRDHRQPLASTHSWTPLFFLDEAVALAAGHRPCALCRREAYLRFRAAWGTATGRPAPRADAIDAVLHEARIVPRLRAKVTFRADLAGLPDGSFIAGTDGPHLVLRDRLLPYTPSGYRPALPRPGSGEVEVLTPTPLVAVLKTGYAPLLHPSAT